MTNPALPIATALIADREGFRAEPYQDSGGTWTIGYGFTYTPTGKPVTASTPPITQPDAYARLQGMVGRVLLSVQVMAPENLTSNQLAALVSFAYNEGTHALRTSTLLLMLNKGDVAGAANQFMSWVYAGGRFVEGLADRRTAERALFLTPDSEAEEISQNPQISAGLSTDSQSEEISPADALNDAELERVQS